MVRESLTGDKRGKMKKTKKGRAIPKAWKATAQKKTAPQQTVAGKARAEGLRLFKVAGRPTREQVILVYGERGPVMTLAERAKAGVSAKKSLICQQAIAIFCISRPGAKVELLFMA